jgi:hypothetical protein
MRRARSRWLGLAVGVAASCLAQPAFAPPLRTLHQRFPIESLQRPLAEGIIANHPTMPQFRLDADQISDVLAYLKTLEP